MSIALVEDDPDQSALLNYWLAGAGYTTTVCATGMVLVNLLSEQHFDLFVVDWILPDMQGDEVIARIRTQTGWETPILVVTVRNREIDIVTGLNAGADDYLSKPLRKNEFIARIDTLLRRFQPFKPRLLQIDGYKFDSLQQQAWYEGSAIELTQKEFDLAWYLFSHPRQLLSRHELLDKIWGVNADMDTRTVDTHISRLRRKLRLTTSQGWHLKSIYGYGYRLENTLI